ncbi:MAG: energy transducer TonB [Cytophagales bacterium]|nr:energy transducer TonB [Cytophagales bacterium]
MAFLISGAVLISLIIIALIFSQLGNKIRQHFTKQKTLQINSLVKTFDSANIQKKRGVFLLSGLFIAISFATVLIEYKSVIITKDLYTASTTYADDDIIYVPITQQREPEPPAPPKKITPEFIPTTDPIIDDPIIDLDPEIDPKDVVIDDPYDDDGLDIVDEPIDLPEDPFDIYALQEQPEFPGGMAALQRYVIDNFQVSSRIIEMGIQGKIYVQFIIEKDGSVSGVEVLRGIDKQIDKEAQRVISSFPKWKPGKNAGAPVRVRYMYPITIKH